MILPQEAYNNREEELAEMFKDSIEKITLTADIANWLIETLSENSKEALDLQDTRLKTLRKEQNLYKNRLKKLVDAKLDGDISEDVFNAKQREYTAKLEGFESAIASCSSISMDAYKEGFKFLELSKHLPSIYKK